MRVRAEAARPFVTGGPSGDDDLTAELALEVVATDDGWQLTLANPGDHPISVRACGLEVPLETAGPVRMFANGYQSWSPTGLVTLGVDEDPSRSPDTFELFNAAHHADGRSTAPGELRSELVTVLADDGDDLALLGWLGGDRHDGTFRLREAGAGADVGASEIVIEAFLGGAVLEPGGRRTLHAVRLAVGRRGGHAPLLDAWASACGELAGARTTAPFQVGWCSWYHYFDRVTETDLDANLALAVEWPFDVFQLDDGFQSHVGDWLVTRDTFPSALAEIADKIRATGRRAGIWIAPFLAHPESQVHTAHPEWIAGMPDGSGPLPGGINDIWGGIVNLLDTTHPEVLDHLESLARALVDAGFTYLKLDFTYAPSFEGRFFDPQKTPAERVRAGYDAIRRGAGEDAFILGCGAPLGPCIGVVDGMRIGPDVAPHWYPGEEEWAPVGYRDTRPSTRNGWQSTVARSFMHRRLWLNDPDCLMLRTDATEMTAEQVQAWAECVAVSGGMAIVSDDLALLGDEARALLEHVIDVGREVDAAAASGPAPECPDLLEHRPPTTLQGAGHTLAGPPDLM